MEDIEVPSSSQERFRPLRENYKLIQCLVSTKLPHLETKDDLKRRIDDAAKYIPLENLCLSPQCGFASMAVGNNLSEDDQWRKLALVAETSEEVWG